jgi:hypothetical protein
MYLMDTYDHNQGVYRNDDHKVSVHISAAMRSNDEQSSTSAWQLTEPHGTGQARCEHILSRGMSVAVKIGTCHRSWLTMYMAPDKEHRELNNNSCIVCGCIADGKALYRPLCIDALGSTFHCTNVGKTVFFDRGGYGISSVWRVELGYQCLGIDIRGIWSCNLDRSISWCRRRRQCKDEVRGLQNISTLPYARSSGEILS